MQFLIFCLTVLCLVFFASLIFCYNHLEEEKAKNKKLVNRNQFLNNQAAFITSPMIPENFEALSLLNSIDFREHTVPSLGYGVRCYIDIEGTVYVNKELKKIIETKHGK
jgi:hypothetical protein